MKRTSMSVKAKQEKQTAKLKEHTQKTKKPWGSKTEEDCNANIKPENNFSPVKSLF